MSLPAGTRLGAYEIVSLLGAGGMGEVYRARDARLHRDVAVKIISQALSADPERVARFEREAQALAALSHPNIARIYGFEEHAHTRAIVMELVEGATVAQLIAAAPGGLPVSEAVVLARQMAEAVETAHEHGVIHRDFKPGNVMVGADDRVKVLDFGLARIADAAGDLDAANSPTVASPVATRAGIILGTAAYMAPEQAKGRAADKRSDVWSFGCVLYEMLTGTAAFRGENVADTLASVLTRETDWSRLPPATPRAVRLCVQRCLIRDRHDRIADMSTVRFLLAADAGLETSAGPHATAIPARPLRGGARRWAWAGATVMLVAAAASAGWLLRPASRAHSPTARFEVPLPQAESANSRSIAISPDGTMLVLAGNRQLFLRPLGSTETLPIPGSDDDPTFPVFAPNGQSILYWRRGQALHRIGIAGGAPETVAELPQPPSDIAWDGDTILVALNNREAAGIFALPSRGGSLRQVVKIDRTEVSVSQPYMVSGTHVLYTERRVNIPVAMGANSLMIAPLDGSDKPKVVQKNASSGHVLPSGSLAYIGDGAIRVAPFDRRTLTVTGDSTAVVPTVGSWFSVSLNGTLVHGAPIGTAPRLLVWVDRTTGTETEIAPKLGPYYDVRISPDGQRIALCQNGDIWIWSIPQETLTNLTLTNDAAEYNPLWADNDHVVFDSADAVSRRILKRAVDGTGPTIELAKVAGYPEVLSKDGRWLVYHTQANIAMVLPLDPPGPPKPLAAENHQAYNTDLSPNGQWIAYQSDRSGRNEIYVKSFPALDGLWQITTDGGAHPLWARSGRELFYIDDAGKMISVAVQTDGRFTHDKHTTLFPAGQYYFNVARNYDVTEDGRRFVTTRTIAGPASRSVLTVATNWFDEVTAKLRPR